MGRVCMKAAEKFLIWWAIDGLPLYIPVDGTSNLGDIFQPVACDAGTAEILPLYIAGDRFSITLWFVRLIVVIHIVRPKPIDRHVRPPAIVPALEFAAQVGQMIDASDQCNTPEPLIFERFVDTFGYGNGAMFADGSQSMFDVVFAQ